MKNKLSKKKTNIIALSVLLCFVLLIICATIRNFSGTKTSDQDWSLESMRSVSSKITTTTCIICKQIELYGNEDNLGIIFLNENTAYHVGVNKYDDSGNLIKKKDTYMQILSSPSSDSRKGINITTDSNRGYATVDISLCEKEAIDMQIAAANCCSDCLNIIQEEYYSTEPNDIVVINYKTKEMRLLSSNLISFLMGDYYVSCDQRGSNDKSKSTEFDLLIFYCPERYN